MIPQTNEEIRAFLKELDQETVKPFDPSTITEEDWQKFAYMYYYLGLLATEDPVCDVVSGPVELAEKTARSFYPVREVTP